MPCAVAPDGPPPGVRPGCTLVSGCEPHAGERVWLTRAACYQVYADGWWLVQRVEAAYVPGFVHLHAVRAADPTGPRERLYTAVSRLYVERPTPVLNG